MFFRANIRWLNDGSEKENYLFCETELLPKLSTYFDDDVFFYGLTRNEAEWLIGNPRKGDEFEFLEVFDHEQ